jgi:hypothetical protein
LHAAVLQEYTAPYYINAGAGGGRLGGVMCDRLKHRVVRAADPLRRRACESDRGRIYYVLRVVEVVRFYVYVSRARSFAKRSRRKASRALRAQA